MRLLSLRVDSASLCGGLFDGLDVWFGRDKESALQTPLAPMCIIGPNGSGKSQFLQLLAEIFQAAWFEHAPGEERKSSIGDILFELTYLIWIEGKDKPTFVRLVREKKGRAATPILLYINENEDPLTAGTEGYSQYLPSIVVGYTSGDNETLSLPFLFSRSGYATDVLQTAFHLGPNSPVLDNRLMLIDYGTNLEVLFSNLMLGASAVRTEILQHARVADLASCRCVVRLAHSAINRVPKKQAALTGRKGIQLTRELEDAIQYLKRSATCWSEDEETETYTFDFYISDATRLAFSSFWKDAFSLYRSLHKLALLNDLAIPRAARKRLERAVKERRFASRLPEPQQEEMVFGFEEVRFWPIDQGKAPVDYVSLSDGEHQQALILGMYAMVSEKNALFLLDEPESHFNPQWRVKFVQRLLKLTGARSFQEMLMTSHAPFVPSDMAQEQILIFSRKGAKLTVRPPEIETFGATFDRILESCFNVSPPISRIAVEVIDKLLDSNDIDEIERNLHDLGQSVEKAFLVDHLRKLKSHDV